MVSVSLKSKIILMVSALLALQLSLMTLLILYVTQGELKSSIAGHEATLVCTVAAALLAASIVLMWVMMRRLMAPLLSFTRQVMAISGDDAEPTPVRIESNDEIQRLARAFNNLMEDIARHKKDIEQEKEFELSLLQHSSLPTFVIDADHRLIHWNSACETLTGIRAEDIIGGPEYWRPFFDHQRLVLADLALEENYDTLMSLYPNCERRDDALHAEGWYRGINGADRYLSFYAKRIYGRDGEVTAAIEIVEDITARKMAEETLRKLSCAVEQSPNAVVITDTGGDVEYVNPKFSSLTGYSAGEVTGRNLRLLQSGNSPPDQYREMWETISSGEIWRGEFNNKKKSGELYWEAASISPVKNEAGVVTHYVALKEDITERKKAAEQVRQTLSLLNGTLESTADGIVVRNNDGKVTAYNKKFAQMWPIPEEMLASHDERELRQFVVDQVKDAERFMGVAEMHYLDPELESRDIFELNDGRIFERVSKPQWVEHQVVGRVVSYRDITERERAQEALRETAERYRSLVDNIDLGITLIDAEHRILMTNPAQVRMMGRSAGELQEKYCYREFERRESVCGHCPGVTAMKTGHTATVETVGVRGDGTPLPVRIQAFPVLGRDGRAAGFIEVIQDITEQLAAEAEKKLLEEQLRQSHKMEALGTMAGGIAHDFNNILTAIGAYCSLIERRLPEDSAIRQYLEKLVASTDRASALTQSLLAYSRKQALNPQRMDMNAVVGSVGHLLSRLLGEDVDLALQQGEGTLTVKADSSQLGQVLMNLAANARDAMPEGGVLRISTCRVEMDADFIKSHGFGEPGSYALIAVSDTGAGMDEETRARIFEPFFTTKEAGKGTGLGLAVAYGIVKQHNGYIDVSSSLGEGTTFSIYLPMSSGAREEVPAVQTADAGGGQETILLVEDDPEIRTTLKELLELEGYSIIAAVDGEDGVEQFRRHAEVIDMLLLDVVMPKKNGRVVYEEIREISPGIKALFISGYTADILDAKGMAREEYNFLSKPIGVSKLLQKMRDILEVEEEAA